MNNIFRKLTKTNARFLKSVILQSFSKYRKGYNNITVKSGLKLLPLTNIWAALGAPNYMYLIELYETFLEWF